MTKPPVLKDWKSLLEAQLEKVGHGEADLRNLIYLCEDYLEQIRPPNRWLQEQARFLERILVHSREIYSARFQDALPPRPKDQVAKEVLLDTPERRRHEVREVALAISKSGDEVTDKAVLEELGRRGMKLVADNPTATISTILNGFTGHFEKVKGKRGVFRRKATRTETERPAQ